MLTRLAVVAMLVTGSALAQAPTKPPFDPVGRWRMHHTDGSEFAARLAADQTATTNFGGGERGIWRWEGAKVRVMYTDGWDDLLSLEPEGKYTKGGWSPGLDRCGPAANQTAAEHISPDPGPPL